MPGEANVEEAAATSGGAQEGQPSDAEILSALGLDENLQPIDSPEVTEGKAPSRSAPQRRAPQRQAPASGVNAGDEESSEEEEPPEEIPDTDEGREEEVEVEEQAPPEEEEPPAAKGIQAMQKRIDRLTAMRHELEGENANLKASLEKASAVTLAPTAQDPLSDLQSEREVDAYIDQQSEYREWCFKHLHSGGEITHSNGQTRELSPQEVGAAIAWCDKVIHIHAPRRKEFLRIRGNYDAMARRAYPRLYQSSTQEAKIMADFLRECPGILRVPNYQVIIGDAIRGMQVRMAAEAKNGGQAATPANGGLAPRLAPRAIKPGATPLQQPTRKAGVTSRLEREFLGSGDKNALTAFIASTL